MNATLCTWLEQHYKSHVNLAARTTEEYMAMKDKKSERALATKALAAAHGEAAVVYRRYLEKARKEP